MITCLGCKKSLDDLDTPAETEARARYLGWRLFDGMSSGNTPLKVTWCPNCFEKGTPRAVRGTFAGFEGQEAFDI